MLTYEQLTLNLLEFALKQAKPRSEYFISEDEHEELAFPHEWGGKCSIKSNGRWLVYSHDERYQVRHLARHDDVMSASNDFFNRVLDNNGIYEYRKLWERSTGLEF